MPFPNKMSQQGFDRISDMARITSFAILLIHIYHFCHPVFLGCHLTGKIPDRIVLNIEKTGLLNNLLNSKLIALGFLAISFLSTGSPISPVKTKGYSISFLIFGMLIYFGCVILFYQDYEANAIYFVYIISIVAGYLLIMVGGNSFSGLFKKGIKNDVFNSYNETFPQEERLIENEYSINFRAKYRYKNQIRKSWINIVNPMRGILICGTPGSGKTYFVVEQIIEQHIRKGFALVVYDFKYPDLSTLAYNYYLKYHKNYPVEPDFHYLNFDDPNFSHRCNFLHPDNLEDISDAAEFSRAFLLGLNKEWIEKQGDFWVESPINLLTAIIWFLRKYRDGKFCTFPHAIELLQADYQKLFSILSTLPEIETYVNPFRTAFLSESTKQLQGQVDGLKIAVARISSPKLYYILSGNDFTLDIANPKKPQILCLGNTPNKSQIYGSVISVYLTAIQRRLNRPGNHKSHIILEEFPTVYLNSIDKTLALSRSYNVATTIVIQNYSQLKLYYGNHQAEVIFNLPGNIICGQSYGETARLISERIGRILHSKESISKNSRDVSVSHSQQLDYAIPQSGIGKLSPGEMVGLLASNSNQNIKLNSYHAQLKIDKRKNEKVLLNPKRLPLIRINEEQDIFENYLIIKKQIVEILTNELNRMINTPELVT